MARHPVTQDEDQHDEEEKDEIRQLERENDNES